jgi:hypothetical protein
MADKGDLGWRLLAGAAAFGAGFVARKAITIGWKQVTGKEPPTNPESPEVELAEAIGWAVVTGVGMEVARLLATSAGTAARVSCPQRCAAPPTRSSTRVRESEAPARTDRGCGGCPEAWLAGALDGRRALPGRNVATSQVAANLLGQPFGRRAGERPAGHGSGQERAESGEVTAERP